MLVQARALGEKVIGEIELAARFLPKNIVAITGSKGKTTTTSLTGEILAAGGECRPWWAGNIGDTAISLVDQATPESVVVLEVSSFQLETIETFRPKIACLNVTPDHFDRHRTFEAYVDAKARIFENQTDNDFAVLNADDSACVTLASRARRASLLVQPAGGAVKQGASVRDGKIFLRDGMDSAKSC